MLASLTPRIAALDLMQQAAGLEWPRHGHADFVASVILTVELLFGSADEEAADPHMSHRRQAERIESRLETELGERHALGVLVQVDDPRADHLYDCARASRSRP